MSYNSLRDAENFVLDHTALNSGMVSAAYGEHSEDYNCILCN